MACPEEEECQGKPGAHTHSVRRVETPWQRGPAREENRRRRKLRHSRCSKSASAVEGRAVCTWETGSHLLEALFKKTNEQNHLQSS